MESSSVCRLHGAACMVQHAGLVPEPEASSANKVSSVPTGVKRKGTMYLFVENKLFQQTCTNLLKQIVALKSMLSR